MVFFICEVCNECIKKPKVEQHTYSCRNAWIFSCMDCGVSFAGEAYKAHTSCVSEAQRYEGKFFVAKENKGDKKQANWMEGVLSRLEAAPTKHAGLKSYLEKLTQYDNLPRKKAKFVNFAKNSLNLKADREGIAEKLWEVIEATGEGDPAPAAPAPAPAAVAAPAAAAAAAAAPAAAEAPAKSTKGKRERSGVDGEVAASATAEKKAKTEEKEKKEKKEEREEKEEKEEKEKKEKKGEKDKTGEKGETEGKEKKGKKKEKEKKKKAGTDVTGAASEDAAPAKASKGEGKGDGGDAKPIKWKKIIAKELTSLGGKMSLKELRKVTIAEVMAHPSHTGRRKKAELEEEFDREMTRFQRFRVEGNQVSFAPEV